MRRRKNWSTHETTGEFELDLAPLLAVMVKLVPVLLLSSAFVQLMVIETELPQVVREAVVRNDEKPTIRLRLEAAAQVGLKLTISGPQGEKTEIIPMKDGGFDYPALHSKLIEVKTKHPEVFKLDLVPGGGVPYGEIVKMMDEARRARDNKITFPVFDQQKGAMSRTPYMFPEIVFANSLEG